jgi:L-cysteine:1D-myo-inositol 2-amino-2-deoxy-alpha-D-glucopyranoside ligase
MRLYNTLSQQVEQLDFPDGIVRMYVCGITPYDTSHLGHARVGIVYDTLRRYLEHAGNEVRYVQNVTDIDDPLFERAERDGISWDVLGQRETERYLRELARVNVPKPPIFVRATEVIGDMLPIIQKLIDAGHAYVADGAVYYDTKSFAEFGAIFHSDYAEMLATANERGNFPDDPRKRDPLDFVLWQPSGENEPSWPSPWGPGRPGWHIECSTIATRYLGPQIDIHGGGADLIFPHHSAEIAQAEPANGVSPFVRCWMHLGMIYLGGEKMSKSLGNMLFVEQLLEKHSPDGLRLSVLGHHYRAEYEPTDEEFRQADHLAGRIREAATAGSAGSGEELDLSEEHAAFFAALDDDFDTPRAIDALAGMADKILEAASNGRDVRSAQQALCDAAGLLGLTASTYAQYA